MKAPAWVAAVLTRQGSPGGHGWPKASLRAYLVAVMLIATVPLALLLSAQIVVGVREQQAQRERMLAERSAAVSARLQHEVDANLRALRLLADAAPEDGAAAWRARVARLNLERRLPAGWTGVTLDDPAAASATPDARSALGVPLALADGSRWTLSARIAPAHWQAVLDSSLPHGELRARLVDGQGGTIAASTLARGPAIGAAGTEGATLRQALAGTGWTLALGPAQGAPDRGQEQAVLRALSVVAACLVLGLVLASLLARRVVDPLARLADDEASDGADPADAGPVLEVERLQRRLHRSRAEESAARARLEVKAAEFQALFEGSPIALAFAQDKQCRAVVHNPAMQILFGPATDAEPLQVRVDGRALPREQQPLQRAARTGVAVPAMELEVVTPGRPSTVVLAQAVPLFDAQGRPRGAIGAAIDITLRQQAEARLREADRERAGLVQREQAARIEAERANQAKDEFLAMLGHELRNPLGAIASAMDVLAHPGADALQREQARDIAARQTRNLARMLDDVLDVARVVAGKILLARQPLELSALLQRVVGTLRLGPAAEGHEVTLDLDRVWIEADATRIEQVVINLLTNAFKYTPPGSRVTLTLRVSSVDGASVAELAVADTGPGIPAELLPHVFDLFVQGERGLDRRAGGLGVGLTLVRRLVELHEGSVQAHSDARGSRFVVRLPAIAAPERPPGPAGDAARSGPPRRVVLVEDNLDAATTLQRRLELDGHNVHHAADGETGLALLLQVWPDVAVVDIGLPGLTGLQLATEARAAGFPGVMLAVSGYGQEADRRAALRSGFDDLLVKPVDAPRLRAWFAHAPGGAADAPAGPAHPS